MDYNVKLQDCYTQRELDPNGRSLALFQYKYEHKILCIGGEVYDVSVRFLGDSYAPHQFYVQLGSGSHWASGYFGGGDLCSGVYSGLIKHLVAHKSKQA